MSGYFPNPVSFNTHSNAGSGSNQHIDIQLQESSGSAADENDELEYVSYVTSSGGGSGSSFLLDLYVPFGTDPAAPAGSGSPTASTTRESRYDLEFSDNSSNHSRQLTGYALVDRQIGDQMSDYHIVSYLSGPVSGSSQDVGFGRNADGEFELTFSMTNSTGTTEIWSDVTGGKMTGSTGADPNNLLSTVSQPADAYKYTNENRNMFRENIAREIASERSPFRFR
ncbi:MAG: hypothetical protein R3C49_04925 [Planctomycetaceae bacterium]